LRTNEGKRFRGGGGETLLTLPKKLTRRFDPESKED